MRGIAVSRFASVWFCSHCRTWCAISKNPTKKHKNLPWGENLVNNDLKQSLLAVFTKLYPDKLCKLDTSNNNESFNNTLRSKAPKDKHYSDGGSLAHRLSAAVCQKMRVMDMFVRYIFFITFLIFLFLKLH